MSVQVEVVVLTEVTICEAHLFTIACQIAGERLFIDFAMFGRYSNHDVCPHETLRSNAACEMAADVTDLIGNTCNGRENCTVAAHADAFTDPCPGTYKYLHIKYYCQDCWQSEYCDVLPDTCDTEHNRKLLTTYNCFQTCTKCNKLHCSNSVHKWSNYCDYWAMRGECSRNKEWMVKHCKLSCRACLSADMIEHAENGLSIDTGSNIDTTGSNIDKVKWIRNIVSVDGTNGTAPPELNDNSAPTVVAPEWIQELVKKMEAVPEVDRRALHKAYYTHAFQALMSNRSLTFSELLQLSHVTNVPDMMTTDWNPTSRPAAYSSTNLKPTFVDMLSGLESGSTINDVSLSSARQYSWSPGENTSIGQTGKGSVHTYVQVKTVSDLVRVDQTDNTATHYSSPAVSQDEHTTGSVRMNVSNANDLTQRSDSASTVDEFIHPELPKETLLAGTGDDLTWRYSDATSFSDTVEMSTHTSYTHLESTTGHEEHTSSSFQEYSVDSSSESVSEMDTDTSLGHPADSTSAVFSSRWLTSTRPRKDVTTHHHHPRGTAVTHHANAATNYGNAATHYGNAATHHGNAATHQGNASTHHENAATHHWNAAHNSSDAEPIAGSVLDKEMKSRLSTTTDSSRLSIITNSSRLSIITNSSHNLSTRRARSDDHPGELIWELTLDMPWKDVYYNIHDKETLTLKAEIKFILMVFYRNLQHIADVHVLTLRPGSIVVRHKVLFDHATTTNRGDVINFRCNVLRAINLTTEPMFDNFTLLATDDKEFDHNNCTDRLVYCQNKGQLQVSDDDTWTCICVDGARGRLCEFTATDAIVCLVIIVVCLSLPLVAMVGICGVLTGKEFQTIAERPQKVESEFSFRTYRKAESPSPSS